MVDENGQVLGAVSRGRAHDGSKILHPVVHLHVFNSKGELYLQHRPAWKDIQPNRWDTAVGGHVDLGENVEQALHREVREELGITQFAPESLGHYVFESLREKELVYVHRCVYDGEVSPSKSELDGGRFWSRQEILDNMGKGVFTPNFENEYRKFSAKPQSAMEPKFIITLDGYMRIGQVRMHKDLLQPHDTCIGGGFWEIDYASMRLLLSGKSFDYGKPKWTLVTGKLYVPSAYRGMQIEYTGTRSPTIITCRRSLR